MIKFCLPAVVFITVEPSKVEPVTVNAFPSAVTIISALPPPNNLNPFKKDEVENLLQVLSNPKEFYTFCRLNEIISPLVGTLFGHCYPGFYHMYLDMYLDDYENMNYQEQINFRKCFGLTENNTQLITLCSSHINKDFNPQGAIQ